MATALRAPGHGRPHVVRRAAAGLALGALLAGAGLSAAHATTPPAVTTASPADPATGATVAQADPNLTVEALGLEAVAGFDGSAVRNTWMPVTVRLTPRQLFSGRIEVRNDRRISESREVEVAGGATKEFTFVVPSGSIQVQVQPDGSDEALQIRPRVDGNVGGSLMGISPEALAGGGTAAGLPNVEIAATAERAVWVPVDPFLLEQTHLVATGLSTLVITADELRDLPEAARTNLELAVLDGLNLTVVHPSGPVDLELPWNPVSDVTASGASVPTVVPADQAWKLTLFDVRPEAVAAPEAGLRPEVVLAASVPAGRGRVVVTGLSPVGAGDQADSAVWAHLLAERDASHRLNGQHSTERGWIAQEALSSGGVLDVPSLGLLAIFALAYVLVIGPGNALLLKRLGRRELGWVTVPVMTVGFIGLAAVVASGTQPRVGIAGSAATWVDGRGSEIVVAAVRAPNAGTHEVRLPGPDWQVDPTTADFSGLGIDIDRSSGDVAANVELQSLQVGTVIAHRHLDEAPPLQVTARATSDGIVVEVVNTSPRTLENVQVRVGGHVLSQGTLAPGESATANQADTRLRQLDVYKDVFQEARKNDGTVEAPRSFRALISGQALADRPGAVVVVADDPAAPNQVTADGSPVESLGRTVAVVTTLDGSGDVLPVEVDRALLVGGFMEAWQPSPNAVEGQLSAVLRYRLPARAAGAVANLHADVERGEGGFEGGMPIPVPGGQGAACVNVETSFPDGSASGSSSCGEDLQVPPCPEDAVACEIGGDFWRFEFEDGRVENGFLTFEAVELPRNNIGFGNLVDAIEVYDHVGRTWVRLREVVGEDQVLAPRHLSPLGEVHLRVEGGLFPFDFSARGIGARLEGVQA